LDELFQFPNDLVHDDSVDALSYIDQLANVAYGIGDMPQEDYEFLDVVSGY
jgi:phage terminase large subunit-like protein